MAITQITGARVFSRLSADALPTLDPLGAALIIGDLLVTEDGNKEQYSYGQAGWYQRPLTDGAADTAPKNSALWVWPNTWSEPKSGTATGTGAGISVIETNDVSMYSQHEISITTAPTSSSVQVLISQDGTNYEPTALMVVDRSVATGEAAGQIDAITAIGNYYFKGKFAKWKIANLADTTVAVSATIRSGNL